MATTDTQIAASPDEVFAVLAKAENYGDWVVGSDTIRDADPTWPKVRSRFYHRIGVGPLKVNGHTEVLEVDPPHRLVMHARAGPLGTEFCAAWLSKPATRAGIGDRGRAGWCGPLLSPAAGL